MSDNLYEDDEWKYEVDTEKLFCKLTGRYVGISNSRGYKIFRNPYLKKNEYLHRRIYKIMHGEIPEGMHIDHINRDRSNNHIENLRLVTNQQNITNSSIRTDNKSGFRGVCYCKREKKWLARIKLNGKQKSLGYFDNIEECAKARDAKAKELNEEFNLHFPLNFP